MNVDAVSDHLQCKNLSRDCAAARNGILRQNRGGQGTDCGSGAYCKHPVQTFVNAFNFENTVHIVALHGCSPLVLLYLPHKTQVP